MKTYKIDMFKDSIMKHLKVTVHAIPTYWVRRAELHKAIDPEHHKEGGNVFDVAMNELADEGLVEVKRHKGVATYVTAV